MACGRSPKPRIRDGERVGEMLRWGLIPFFARALGEDFLRWRKGSDFGNLSVGTALPTGTKVRLSEDLYSTETHFVLEAQLARTPSLRHSGASS